MKSKRINISRGRLFFSIVGIAFFASFPSSAQGVLDDIWEASEVLNEEARKSQVKVEDLVDQTQSLFADYKQKLKIIEGLQVYNRQLERQIARQEEIISQIKQSIDEVTGLQTQVVPLMLRMIEGLDQFVAQDKPFLMAERTTRVENLRELMDRPDVTVAEQFSQVLRAYQIENEYGRTMDTYTQEIEIEGQPRTVDVLRVGRIALVYQSSDGEATGWWNPNSGQWEELDDEYTTPVRNGLKMARKQLTTGLFKVPVLAPQG